MLAPLLIAFLICGAAFGSPVKPSAEPQNLEPPTDDARDGQHTVASMAGAQTRAENNHFSSKLVSQAPSPEPEVDGRVTAQWGWFKRFIQKVNPCHNNKQRYESCWACRGCASGLSCHPFVQKCYDSPRKHGQPCMWGYSCGSGLSCQPGVHKCYHSPRELGEPCMAGHSCGTGLSCHPFRHVCMHHPRWAGEDCSLGYPCANSTSTVTSYGLSARETWRRESKWTLTCDPSIIPLKCIHIRRKEGEQCTLQAFGDGNGDDCDPNEEYGHLYCKPDATKRNSQGGVQTPTSGYCRKM